MQVDHSNPELVLNKPKKTLSSHLTELADKLSFGHLAKNGSSASSSRTSLLSGGSGSASWSSSMDELDHHITDWSKHGMETLPDKEGYRLVSLWSTPDSSMYSLHRSFSSRSSLASRSSSFYSNPDVDSYGRFIPALVNFRLEWTGPVPLKQANFDLTAISPCFLQAGDYKIDLKWLSDVSGEYVSMAATKNLMVKSKSHLLAKTSVIIETCVIDFPDARYRTGENHVSFYKQHGPAALTVVKEGWMYRAKDRQQCVRVTVDYTPPVEWSTWSDSDLSLSPWPSRPSSRRSSFNSGNGSRPSSVPALPPIPASPAVIQQTEEEVVDEISASVPLDEQPAQRDFVFKSPRAAA